MCLLLSVSETFNLAAGRNVERPWGDNSSINPLLNGPTLVNMYIRVLVRSSLGRCALVSPASSPAGVSLIFSTLTTLPPVLPGHV